MPKSGHMHVLSDSIIPFLLNQILQSARHRVGGMTPKRVKLETSSNNANFRLVRIRADSSTTKNFMNLPLELWLEVFKLLHASDLLRLSRTNLQFRSVLMSRSSEIVWRTARSDIPKLPGPPPGLSEPAWANLAFDSTCHFCSRTGIRRIDFLFRVRTCGACTKKQVISDAVVFPKNENSNEYFLASRILFLIPTRMKKRRERTTGEHTVFLRRDFEQAKECYLSLPENEKEPYIERRCSYLKALKKHVVECQTWSTYMKAMK
ncbi:hypothetical protein EDD18DRAFT_1273677 [Armillaria luteobubalina]|uniref:F-box domain-containing protein n=1 Tax=Armillaria luteobubalina TaxID=153913 RepID=A0AA39QS17_9AGAR|nr:hypothetical protein EDD18DRAFT_1273677 [Armillaria luteobubalina]